MKKSKGTAVVWIVILIAIFTTILLYNVFSLVLGGSGGIFPEIKEFLNDSDASMADRALDTIDTMETVWVYWPLPLILGLFLWGIVSAQKREPMYYNY